MKMLVILWETCLTELNGPRPHGRIYITRKNMYPLRTLEVPTKARTPYCPQSLPILKYSQPYILLFKMFPTIFIYPQTEFRYRLTDEAKYQHERLHCILYFYKTVI